MKVPSCYNCQSKSRRFYAEENGYTLVKCSECGLLYLDERPDDDVISDAHKQGKHSGLRELNVTGKFDAQRIPAYLKVLKDLFQAESSNIRTWLDVGCGHGEFMIAVQEHSHGSCLVRGTEPNILKQESARSRGLNVSYFDLECHADKYDAISLLNVYSHLPDPPVFIEGMKKCLKPDGSLIIETGDTADLSAGDHFRPFNLPDHLSFASERIVVGILQRSGFEVVNIMKYPLIKHRFFRRSPRRVAKDIIKAVLPHYRGSSTVKYFGRRYSQTDMYIWARLKC